LNDHGVYIEKEKEKEAKFSHSSAIITSPVDSSYYPTLVIILTLDLE
jgi:hypothetical protein